jgi:hypothetical protein
VIEVDTQSNTYLQIDESIRKFKENIIQRHTKEIYQEYLLSNSVWYFENFKKVSNPNIYDEFKRYISRNLEIHPTNISIVGSGKIGFSTSPKKMFKPFSEESDLDIVLVDNRKFHFYWNEYLNQYKKGSWIFNYQEVSSSVFRKFISFNGFHKGSDIYNNWIKRTDSLNKDLQTQFDIEHKVNYRIFESWDAVETYYLSNFNKIKEELIKENS